MAQERVDDSPAAAGLVLQDAGVAEQLQDAVAHAGLDAARQRLLGGDRPGDEQPLPRRIQPGVRDRVLKLLRDAGILEHEARGRWRVIDPLLRHYLASLDPLG